MIVGVIEGIADGIAVGGCVVHSLNSPLYGQLTPPVSSQDMKHLEGDVPQ